MPTNQASGLVVPAYISLWLLDIIFLLYSYEVCGVFLDFHYHYILIIIIIIIAAIIIILNIIIMIIIIITKLGSNTD